MQEPYIINVDDLNNSEICQKNEMWALMGGEGGKQMSDYT